MNGLLFYRTWWSYDVREAAPAEAVYHYFNLGEAAVWVALSVAVLFRYAKHRRSALEPAYALAFLSFGLTDVQEAWKCTVLAAGHNHQTVLPGE